MFVSERGAIDVPLITAVFDRRLTIIAPFPSLSLSLPDRAHLPTGYFEP